MSIDWSSEKIAQFCRRRHICEMSLFGSVLRDDFHLESDIDVLVSFDEQARYGLFDLVRMENELGEIFGRKVDLVSKRGIESSRNYLRRNAILNSAKVIYAA
jgi:predicted nucleotidyltransferase